jgi:hypothetical protein
LIYCIFWILDFFIEFWLDDLSIDDNGMLKSPTSTVLMFIYAFRSFRVCLMKLGVLTLGAYSHSFNNKSLSENYSTPVRANSLRENSKNSLFGTVMSQSPPIRPYLLPCFLLFSFILLDPTTFQYCYTGGQVANT